MSRRGNTLLLILVVLAMLAAGGAVFATRLSAEHHRRPADDLRLQALWLARSALHAGVGSSREVQTEAGPARLSVTVRGAVTTARVELLGAVATVQSEPYVERFERP